MRKLHVTQDDFGFWQLSLEEADGSLRLLAHRAETADHLVENARELVAEGRYRDAAVVVDPPRKTVAEAAPDLDNYTVPPPRKAGE
jgi:hypothetical protein